VLGYALSRRAQWRFLTTQRARFAGTLYGTRRLGTPTAASESKELRTPWGGVWQPHSPIAQAPDTLLTTPV
jgi:hypothetical protein